MMRLVWIALGVFGLFVSACGGGNGNSPAKGAADGGAGATGDDTASATTAGRTQGDGMQLFLLFGQSNMEGAPKPEAMDLEPHPRVQVLGYDDFGTRRWNEWDAAVPPLHRSWAGVGPGDTFGKAMAEAWPNATIGLIPCAISGVDIDFFRKGVVSARRDEFSIPPDNTLDSAYDMMIERAQLAQQSGVIRGILFHQGESDNGNAQWLTKLEQVVADLRADLGLGEDVPFVAGETLHGGCCSLHNTLVARVPDSIPNAHVVSAADLGGMDEAHFDLEGQRTLGRRYAEVMLPLLEAP